MFLKVSGFALILLSAIIRIVSIATDHWVTSPLMHFGLWTVCTKWYCSSMFNDSASLNVTRAFLIISLGILLIAAILQLIAISGNHSAQKHAGSLANSAALLSLVGMSVFTSKSGVGYLSSTYSWSYAIGWVSSALTFVAGAVCHYGFRKGRPVEAPRPIPAPVTVSAPALQMTPQTTAAEGDNPPPYSFQPEGILHYPGGPQGYFQPYPGAQESFQPYPGAQSTVLPHTEAQGTYKQYLGPVGPFQPHQSPGVVYAAQPGPAISYLPHP